MTAARVKYRAAWADWWKRHGDALDLAAINFSPHWRGYTLAVCMAAMRGRGGRIGSIVELDARGRTRWQMQGLLFPVDAQVLDERRVLVTELRTGRVTERNHNGDILRSIEVPEPALEARRLPNGHTLITTRSRVYEVDRHDKEVWTHQRQWRRHRIARRLLPARRPDRHLLPNRANSCARTETAKSSPLFEVGRLFRPTATHIQGLPNGHILVPQYYDNKVVEFDGNGREVWSASYPQPASAQRLPNGRTLVAGYGSNVIVELDKNGREVKSQHCDGRLMCVRGR